MGGWVGGGLNPGFASYLNRTFYFFYVRVHWLLKSLCVLSFMALGRRPKSQKKRSVCYQDRRK